MVVSAYANDAVERHINIDIRLLIFVNIISSKKVSIKITGMASYCDYLE
jgi:hypothetical protein